MMASKFLKSSIALLLAKDTFAATDDGGCLTRGGRRAQRQRQKGAVPVPDESALLPKEVLCIPNTNCTAVYNVHAVQVKIMDYVARAITGGEVQFYRDLTTKQQSEILVIGWSGMCFPVDGRCDKIKGLPLDDVVRKWLLCATDRKQGPLSNRKYGLKSAIGYSAVELMNTPQFTSMLYGVLNPRPDRHAKMAAYLALESTKDDDGFVQGPTIDDETSTETYHKLENFYRTIKHAHYAAVSAFGDDKPTWVFAHHEMADSHYQVDIGSGKAEAFKRISDKSNEIKKFEGKKAHVTYKDLQGKPAVKTIIKLMRSDETEDHEEAQNMLEIIGTAMRDQFVAVKDKLCNEEGTLPKASFGVTGDWRAGGKPLIDALRAVLEGMFKGHCEELNVFMVEHEDEAKYGALSWLRIPGFLKAVQDHNDEQFKYFVSLEAGKNSTQVGVIDLTKQELMPATVEVNPEFEVTQDCDNLLRKLCDGDYDL